MAIYYAYLFLFSQLRVSRSRAEKKSSNENGSQHKHIHTTLLRPMFNVNFTSRRHLHRFFLLFFCWLVVVLCSWNVVMRNFIFSHFSWAAAPACVRIYDKNHVLRADAAAIACKWAEHIQGRTEENWRAEKPSSPPILLQNIIHKRRTRYTISLSQETNTHTHTHNGSDGCEWNGSHTQKWKNKIIIKMLLYSVHFRFLPAINHRKVNAKMCSNRISWHGRCCHSLILSPSSSSSLSLLPQPTPSGTRYVSDWRSGVCHILRSSCVCLEFGSARSHIHMH